jgi:hypothetical protein
VLSTLRSGIQGKGQGGKMPHRFRDNALFSFAVQQVVATVGVIVLGTTVTVIASLITASFTPNTSGGDSVDHMVDQPSFKWVAEPYFPAFIVAGLALGALSTYLLRTRVGAWVWVLPFILLLWNIIPWNVDSDRFYWRDVWNAYFSRDCSNSECLYEFFVTAPFYASVAYSLGWLAGRLRSRTS